MYQDSADTSFEGKFRKPKLKDTNLSMCSANLEGKFKATLKDASNLEIWKEMLKKASAHKICVRDDGKYLQLVN